MYRWAKDCFFNHYLCTGGRSSREVHVSVQSPPELLVVPEVVPYQTGDNISVLCIARGFPQPRISWLKQDTSLPDSRLSATDDKLRIVAALPGDQGHYTCTATNSAGTGTDYFHKH